ncbi:MAG: hypothetical protein F4Y89_05990 [Gammaproteobacteria bacterium]|nr:hypothetical protein [Gammaproteobacteria bacterium]MYG96687.1 hypothetical protein [Gammaproteobacteria bacterium]
MSWSFRTVSKISILTSILILAGCATVTSNIYHSPSGQPPPLSSRILVMPPEVVVYLKNAGGNNEPRADWSDLVKYNLTDSIFEYMFENAVEVVPYPSESLLDEHVELIGQAAVMMDAIELSQYQGGATGVGRVYALSGDNIETISDIGADYVLVTELTSEVASTGRIAVAVLTAVAGVYTETSSAQFRVGLFDLRDGQIIWANNDRQALADIGNVVEASPQAWAGAIEHILSEFPL